MTSSPRPVERNFLFPAPVMLPVIGGKDVVVWDEKKPEKPETDLSGTLYFSFLFIYFQYLFLFSKFGAKLTVGENKEKLNFLSLRSETEKSLVFGSMG